MFGWFTSRCPLDTYEKTWTEVRMQWLGEQFGWDQIRETEVFLSADEIFDEPFAGTADQARRWMDRLGEVMRIDSTTLGFEVLEDFQLREIAGHYDAHGERKIIRINVTQLGHAAQLVKTLAHELSHELLLGGGRLTESVSDHERVTDLTPICFGLGVCAANVTILESSWRSGRSSGWSVGRNGYLSSHTFGYALALFAWARNERDPSWAYHLRADAAEPFWAGLKYLAKAKDCLFDPGKKRIIFDKHYLRESERQLADASASVRLAAIWELAGYDDGGLQLLPELLPCIKDKDAAVRRAAIETVGAYGTAAASAGPLLIDALHDRVIDVQAAAAENVARVGADEGAAVHQLGLLIQEDESILSLAAASGLAQFGPAAASEFKVTCLAYKLALKNCHDDEVRAFATALHHMAPNAVERVQDFFQELQEQELDDESYTIAMRNFKEVQAELAATN